MSYVWDTYKGLVFTAEKCKASKEQVITDGLESLDWAAHLPEAELSETQDTNCEAPKTPPQSRKEKREAKKAIKEAKRERKVLAKRTGSVDTDYNGTGYNPYVASKELKVLYKKIKDKTSGSDVKLFQFKSIAFYKSDASHLVPGEWLNDNNISFIYELVQELFLKPSNFAHHIHLMYPSVVQLLMHYPVEEDLKEMVPMDDLRKSKLVFIPFNFMEDCDYVDLEDANNGDHWALCILSIAEKKLFVYDSMAFDADPESDNLLKKLASRITKILFKSTTKLSIVKKSCDQQDNFDDCGVFLIMITCFLISKLLSGETTDLDVAGVKFEPMSGRLQVMKLACKYYMAQPLSQS